jgi:ferredoxin
MAAPAAPTESGAPVRIYADDVAVSVPAGATLLEACDAVGSYVPRLCWYPGLACPACTEGGGTECGLCAVRLGDGSVALACCTAALDGIRVVTDDPELRALRLERLGAILARHPHICLSCPDREGCSRNECTYGHPPEARCCDRLGSCELGRLVEYVDAGLTIRRRAVSAPRTAGTEGRIRREPGICVGCGRCIRICAVSPEAGQALIMVEGSDGLLARSRLGTLREAGCTFCGLCVMVCPTGALTAPGEAGARWLVARREKHGPEAPMLPPRARMLALPAGLAALPCGAGLFRLLDQSEQVIRVSGVADLRAGVAAALGEPGGERAAFLQFELEPLYTQRETEALAQYVREHGHLPPGNDLGDDLFGDDLFDEDI